MEMTLGLLMGFAYMASPGPVNVETLRRGAITGLPAAFAMQSGGMVGHLFYSLLAYTGMHLLLGHSSIQIILSVFSFCLLMYLGISTVKDRNIFTQIANGQARPGCSVAKTFLTGSLISLFNPFAIAFWISLSSQSATIPSNTIPFLTGFFISLAAVGVAMTLLAAFWMKRINATWARLLITSCGLVLIGFAVKVAYSALLPWLS